MKQQLADATSRSKDAQNAAEDSEANWSASGSLLDCCKRSAITADVCMLASEMLTSSPTACCAAASTTLEAHARIQQARHSLQAASLEAQALKDQLEKKSVDGPIRQQPPAGPDPQRGDLDAAQSVALGRCTEAQRALADSQQHVEHTEGFLCHLKSAVECRQDALRALQQVLAQREGHQKCAEELLLVGSDIRAALRQQKIAAEHAAEVRRTVLPCSHLPLRGGRLQASPS